MNKVKVNGAAELQAKSTSGEQAIHNYRFCGANVAPQTTGVFLALPSTLKLLFCVSF
jgi:hypothetical protein